MARLDVLARFLADFQLELLLVVAVAPDGDGRSGADHRRRDQERSGKAKADTSIHRESVPFVRALTTRTLNRRPLSSMRFCSAPTSAGVRLWPAWASSSST